MRVLISTASVTAILAALSGCTLWGSPVPPGRPVRTVYVEGAGSAARPIRIERAPAPGAVGKTRPVIYPPKVFAVWVPEHLDLERDMKIGAHWVYVKLRESSWTPEPIDREPFCNGATSEKEIHTLRRRMKEHPLGGILIPHERFSRRRTIKTSPDVGPVNPFDGDGR